VIHLDLKPANFLMVNGTLKLIDFGIASRIDQNRTHVTKDNQLGTLNFMSPESIQVTVSGSCRKKATSARVAEPNFGAVEHKLKKDGLKMHITICGTIATNIVINITMLRSWHNSKMPNLCRLCILNDRM
jgi:serine/threonine protein kinase